MVVIPETCLAHYIWYLCFYFRKQIFHDL